MTNEQLVILVNDGVNVAENMLELWHQTKRLIHTIAKDYVKYAEIEDLNQEGYIGLCNAVQHYDATKSVSFSTYAAFWIRRAICRYIRTYGCSVRLPEYAQNEMQQYKKVKSDYMKAYGIEPTDEELQGLLGVSQKKYENIKRNAYISYIHSISEPIAGENDDITLGDTLASDDCIEDDVIKSVDTAAMKIELWETVDDLPNKMSEVLKYRYKDGLTLKETGENIGVTLGRVRVIENEAIRKLRNLNHKTRNLRSYYDQYLVVGIRHVGVREFERTWYSEVEMAVLNNMS